MQGDADGQEYLSPASELLSVHGKHDYFDVFCRFVRQERSFMLGQQLVIVGPRCENASEFFWAERKQKR